MTERLDSSHYITGINIHSLVAFPVTGYDKDGTSLESNHGLSKLGYIKSDVQLVITGGGGVADPIPRQQ